jgi:hypothetical protein
MEWTVSYVIKCFLAGVVAGGVISALEWFYRAVGGCVKSVDL